MMQDNIEAIIFLKNTSGYIKCIISIKNDWKFILSVQKLIIYKCETIQ